MGSCALAGPAIAMAVSFPLSSQPGLLSSPLGSAHKARGESLGASSWGSFTRMPPLSRIKLQCQVTRRERIKGIQAAAVTGIDSVTAEESKKSVLPRGASWTVHKFGGTCVGTSERIKDVAEIIVADLSVRKVAVVSAMFKVTDMMYDLLRRAQARDESYNAALDKVYENHKETAMTLLEDGEDLVKFLSVLEADIKNLRAMLRAICIAGHATEPFEDWVVGHGELWSAQLLAAAVRNSGLPCVWMDARDVLVVTPTGKQQVDPDYEALSRDMGDDYLV